MSDTTTDPSATSDASTNADPSLAPSDILILRAAFVPEGQLPPPEFQAEFSPLRLPATYNPATGEIACAEANQDFHGRVRGEFHPESRGDTAPNLGAPDGEDSADWLSRASDVKSRRSSASAGTTDAAAPDNGESPDGLDTRPAATGDTPRKPPRDQEAWQT